MSVWDLFERYDSSSSSFSSKTSQYSIPSRDHNKRKRVTSPSRSRSLRKYSNDFGGFGSGKSEDSDSDNFSDFKPENRVKNGSIHMTINTKPSSGHFSEDSEEDSFGPEPFQLHSVGHDEHIVSMLKQQGFFSGEAEGMVAYAREGKRIPRRGEIGLSAEDIDKLEKVGYVMSGNRNKRMNAVRLKKESQVINLEQDRKAALEKLEQKVLHEHEQLAEFREILNKQSEKLFESGIVLKNVTNPNHSHPS